MPSKTRKSRLSNDKIDEIMVELPKLYVTGVPQVEIQELLELNDSQYYKFFNKSKAYLQTPKDASYNALLLKELPLQVRNLLEADEHKIVKFKKINTHKIEMWLE